MLPTLGRRLSGGAQNALVLFSCCFVNKARPLGVRYLSGLDCLGNNDLSVTERSQSAPSVLPSKKSDHVSQKDSDMSGKGYNIYVDESSLQGLGVFAGREFSVGEIIEICPILELPDCPQVATTSPRAALTRRASLLSDPLLGGASQPNSSLGASDPLKETVDDILADYAFCNGTDSDSDEVYSARETTGAFLRPPNNRSRPDSSYRCCHHRRGRLLALGYGMLYNHSDRPNAYCKLVYYSHQNIRSAGDPPRSKEMIRRNDKGADGKYRKVLRIKTFARIGRGEEIFLDYGEEWWKNRRSMPLSFNFSRFRANISDD
eukprot:GHVS01021264.1.p1 GENE.GHVS01021264.1~~GHVS01021264.1.p1  ORF type:complete len:332 (+),score=29.41 GHVS01021264.1:44-997(+)